MIAAALHQADYVDFTVRFGLDLAAILAVAGVLYLRRHQRRDLFLVYVTFNIGVFSVLAVITEKKISAAVGFGLFALLSIIRLRSQPYANVELAYFFTALVLGVVNGIGHGDRLFKLLIDAIVVVAMVVLDYPRVQPTVQRRRVTLDAVHTDPRALQTDLERRFDVDILDLRITAIDYVRDTTSVRIGFVERHPGVAGGLFALDEDDDAEERS